MRSAYSRAAWKADEMAVRMEPPTADCWVGSKAAHLAHCWAAWSEPHWAGSKADRWVERSELVRAAQMADSTVDWWESPKAESWAASRAALTAAHLAYCSVEPSAASRAVRSARLWAERTEHRWVAQTDGPTVEHWEHRKAAP